jgi:predicted nuclease of predicted toxin-antitoxin system
MKLSRLPLLCDEDIAAEVVNSLRSDGRDATVPNAVARRGGDTAILAQAVSEGRVVLTHDPDFGTLAILSGQEVFWNSLCAARPRQSRCSHTRHSSRHVSRFGCNASVHPCGTD